MTGVVSWEPTSSALRVRVNQSTRANQATRATRGIRPQTPNGQRHCVKAALFDVDSTASLVLHAGVGSTILLAVAVSLSTQRGAADRGAAVPRDAVDQFEFEDSVRWSVMTVLSLFPYLNFATWAFAAIDAGAAVGADADEEEEGEASYFWLLSGLYFVPYLVDGFQLDLFTLLTIAVGAAHVYVGPSSPLVRLLCSVHGA
jgi:hypothetical protein